MTLKNFMKFIRMKIGFYCTDSYWEFVFDQMRLREHPVLWLKENLSYLAINAIATDYSSRI